MEPSGRLYGAALAGSRRFPVPLRAHSSANKSNGYCHWDQTGEHHLWLITTITDEMIAEEKLSSFNASLTTTGKVAVRTLIFSLSGILAKFCCRDGLVTG